MNDATPAPTSLATEEAQAEQQKGSSWWRELLETLLLSAVIFFAVQAVVQSYLVDGRSMVPSLHNSERLFVNKAAYWRVPEDSWLENLAQGPSTGSGQQYLFDAPERGDVIVFHHPLQPNTDLIKRVIGMPGDTVEIISGKVRVNGEELDEPYIGEARTRAYTGGGEGRWQVPPGHFFVLGDNRNSSSDSRDWGFLPVQNVVGQASLRYWPLEELGGVPGPDAQFLGTTPVL